MRIAVASNAFVVAEHLAQCTNINIYTTASYEIAASQNIPCEGSTAEEVASVLDQLDVDVILAAELSPTARAALDARSIPYVEGVHGTAIEAANAYLETKAADLENDLADDE